MEIFALFMFLGIFTSLCIPETARKTLEELSGDNEMAPISPDIPSAEAEKAEKNSL
jgi:PHS family inorganic phosphate transporter-like MFS transporter